MSVTSLIKHLVHGLGPADRRHMGPAELPSSTRHTSMTMMKNYPITIVSNSIDTDTLYGNRYPQPPERYFCRR